MAGVRRHTEDWKALPWKQFQRNVFRLQKRIYQATLMVPMTMAHVLRSRVKRNFHARFWIGGGAGDCPTDHN